MSDKTYKIFNYCVKHPVFSHILLILIISIGCVAIFNIQTQLIPNLKIPQVYINFIWPGSDAKQVEESIIALSEDALEGQDGLNDMVSVSRSGSGTIILKFDQNQDMQDARQKALQNLDSVRFPNEMEDYTLNIIEPKELIARISYAAPLNELESISNRIENSLSGYQINSTERYGIPDYRLELEINPIWMQNHQITQYELINALKAMLRSSPTGFAGKDGVYTASEVGLSTEDILSLNWTISLFGDDALTPAKEIFQSAKFINAENAVQLYANKLPVTEIRIFRSAQEDLIALSKRLSHWYNNQTLGIDLKLYSQTWKYFLDRMYLIGKNGAAGLILILGLLTLFLNRRYAIWVAAGLPISIFGTIALMYLLNFHISMISLFAVILSLGIIVDDAIVVAEQSASLRHKMNVNTACILAASQMLKPVMTSSLTTLAAFFPLLFISGVAGQFLKEIPIVVITVIVASLIECFLILPKHLSSIPKQHIKPNRFQCYFRLFRIRYFLPMVRFSIFNRWIIITAAISFVAITMTLVGTSRIKFSFFPSFSSDQVTIEVDFDPSTSFENKQAYLFELEQALEQTVAEFDDIIVEHYHVIMNQRLAERISANPIDQGIHIWLTDQDKRKIKNTEFIRVLREKAPISPLVTQLYIDQPRGGPPSDQIQVELIGEHENIIAAANELKSSLKTYQGLYDIADDVASILPNHFYRLDELAIHAGLNTNLLQQQVQSYLNKSRNWSLNYSGDDIDIIITMPEEATALQSNLDDMPIQINKDSILPLSSITKKEITYLPQTLIRKNQYRTYTVTAKVNPSVTNTYQIEALLATKTLPELRAKYQINTNTGEIREDQSKTINELKAGAIIGFAVIYLVLSWSLSSFIQPLAILLTLPLALMGGILGHWILGFDITLLSLFGFFGLAGVTVNDSIILSLKYQELARNYNHHQALISASYLRFRAVLLTSLTTVGGLLPLMFETSFQAQFIIPMAITIAFGLLFGTLWILIFLPAILSFMTKKDADVY
ncbi:efflux RND transporter permease subunit [Gammaproteobacteria bacterium]|nr:efflux RND transporter permease subunit [Gammaproteobacteria bacterium]